MSPMEEIVAIAEEFNANVIVDEAHGVGVFGHNGGGLCQELGLESKIFCRVATFGKAFGIHGAAMLGSTTLKSYLINYARPLIYSTALPGIYRCVSVCILLVMLFML